MNSSNERKPLQFIQKCFASLTILPSGIPSIQKEVSGCTVQLPRNGSNPLQNEAVHVDEAAANQLTKNRTINWCSTILSLYPLFLVGDLQPLILFHRASSLAMWGISGGGELLGRLINVTLSELGDTLFKDRWIHQQLRQESTVNNRDWEEIKASACVHDPNSINQSHASCLTSNFPRPMHVFVLSNVIKRPIVILESSSSAETLFTLTNSDISCHFAGIYLPLLQPAADCVRSPIVFVLYNGRLLPLVGSESDVIDSPGPLRYNAVALVNENLEPLQIQFLVDSELKDAHSLLTRYLDVVEINMTKSDGVSMILAAKLLYKNLDQALLDLDPQSEAAAPTTAAEIMTQNAETVTAGSVPNTIATSYNEDKTRCVKVGCPNDGVGDYNGKCSTCHVKECLSYVQTLGVNHSAESVAARPRVFSDPTAPNASIVTFNSVPEPPVEGNMSSLIRQPCAHAGCKFFVSVYTAPYCYEHVGEAELTVHQNTDPVLSSMLEQTCAHAGCSFHASTGTVPFCHEHAEVKETNSQRVTMAASTTTTQVQSNPVTSPLYPRIDSRSEDNREIEMMSTAEAHLISLVNEHCRHVGCTNFASTRVYPMCHEHAVEGGQGINGNQNVVSTTYIGTVATQPLHVPRNTTRCGSRSAPIVGTTVLNSGPLGNTTRPGTVNCNFTGMMQDLESRTKRMAPTCKIPGCHNYGNSKCHGYCHDCFMLSKRFSP